MRSQFAIMAFSSSPISHTRETKKEHLRYFFVPSAKPLIAKPQETDEVVVLETEIGTGLCKKKMRGERHKMKICSEREVCACVCLCVRIQKIPPRAR